MSVMTPPKSPSREFVFLSFVSKNIFCSRFFVTPLVSSNRLMFATSPFPFSRPARKRLTHGFKRLIEPRFGYFQSFHKIRNINGRKCHGLFFKSQYDFRVHQYLAVLLASRHTQPLHIATTKRLLRSNFFHVLRTCSQLVEENSNF